MPPEEYFTTNQWLSVKIGDMVECLEGVFCASKKLHIPPGCRKNELLKITMFIYFQRTRYYKFNLRRIAHEDHTA
jgi:hypothetical protein